MSGFPGIGRRIAERMRTMGFWKDDRPDVARFCRERRYRRQYVYAWLHDRMPGVENLRRLADDLDVTVAWLAVGDDHGAVETAAIVNGHRAAHGSGLLVQHRTSRRPARLVVPRAPGVELTALRDAAGRLVQLEADLQATLAAFPDPCIWVDEHGAIVAVHGDRVPKSFASARILAEALPAAAASALLACVDRAARTGQPRSVEYAAGEREPRMWEARVQPVKSSHRPRKALVVLRDVTERAGREREYRDLVDGSANGMCVHRDSVVLFANRAMARMLEYASPADILGRRIEAIVTAHGDGKQDDRARMSPLGFVRRLRADCVRRDGTRFSTTALVSSVSWREAPATLLTLLRRGHQLSAG
jgi:PAS domain-containing protein